jgi:RimJ/RimL family protein N-acetyltransferase
MRNLDLAAVTPVLSTARLRLRGQRRDDFEDCAAMWADERVTRFIGGKPSTREQCWARLLRYIGHWALMGFGYWVVEEKASGRFMGEIGFANYRRDIDPPLGDDPEMGWVLAPSAFGKGFASEATAAAVAWMDGEFRARRTVCMIDPLNTASLRLAEKRGFREFTRTRAEKPVVLFERVIG